MMYLSVDIANLVKLCRLLPYLLTIRNQAMLTLIHGCLVTFVVVVLTLESALRLKLQLRCLKKE